MGLIWKFIFCNLQLTRKDKIFVLQIYWHAYVILLSISIVYYSDDLDGDGDTDDDNYEDDKGEKREKTQGWFASIPASRQG